MKSRLTVLSTKKEGGIYGSRIITSYQTWTCRFLPGGFADPPVSPRRVPHFGNRFRLMCREPNGKKTGAIACHRCRDFSSPLSPSR